MSLTIINDKHLNDIADALRELHGEDESITYKPSEMAPRIAELETGDGKIIARRLSGEYTNSRIKHLKPYAFARNGAYVDSTPTTINLPNLTTIGEGAFYNAHFYELQAINMPQVSVIPDRCFAESGIPAFDFSRIISVGDEAFFSGGLRDMSLISSSLMSIGEMAFYSSGLTAVDLPSLTYVGSRAFSSMGLLQTIKCNYLTTISEGLVYSTKNLTTAVFPNASIINMRESGSGAFASTTKLQTLVFGGSSVVEIWDTDSDSLAPASWGSKIFRNSGILTTGYIYVRKNLISQYQQHAAWSYLSNRFRAIEDYPEVQDLID